MFDFGIIFPYLGIEIEYFRTYVFLFDIFKTYLSYIMLAAGVLAAITFMLITMHKRGIDVNPYLSVIFVALLSGVLGGRIYYIAFSWEEYGGISSVIDLTDGGYSAVGGIIGGLIGALIMCRIKKLNGFEFLDLAAGPAALGICISRWADFFSYDNFGRFTDNIFAMRISYTLVKDRVTDDIIQRAYDIGIWNFESYDYIQVHPAFLYESVMALAVFILIMVFYRLKRYNGEVILWFLTAYGLINTFTFSLRTGVFTDETALLRVSEYTAAAIFIAAFVIWVVKRVLISLKRPRN